MKTNTVKQLKENLEEKWKHEEDFIEGLKERYPNMFNYRDVVLNSSAPVGWESIITDLCGSINNYATNTKRYRKKTDLISKGKIFLNNISRFILNKINFIIDPYRPFRPKDQKMWMIPQQIQEKVRSSKRYALQKKINSFYHKYLSAGNCYEEYSSPEVYVAQIKDKFGGLRFYYDGGDEIVDGMVRFAEYLCSKTCEETGAEGNLCVRRSWYRTLSEEKAKELGYNIKGLE
jgi:hypothetical protein